MRHDCSFTVSELHLLKDNIFEENECLIKPFQMTEKNIMWKCQANFKSRAPNAMGVSSISDKTIKVMVLLNKNKKSTSFP